MSSTKENNLTKFSSAEFAECWFRGWGSAPKALIFSTPLVLDINRFFRPRSSGEKQAFWKIFACRLTNFFSAGVGGLPSAGLGALPLFGGRRLPKVGFRAPKVYIYTKNWHIFENKLLENFSI